MKYNFDQFTIKRYEDFTGDEVSVMFNDFKVNFFAFDLNNKELYISDYLEKRFRLNIHTGVKLSDVLSFVFDQNMIVAFYDLIMLSIENRNHQFSEFPIKFDSGYKWYKVEIGYDEERNVVKGLFVSSGVSNSRDFYMREDKKELIELIELLPHPVFLFDKDELVHTNYRGEHIVEKLHSILKNQGDKEYIDYSNYSEIIELERVKRVDEIVEYSLVKRVDNILKFFYVQVTKHNDYTLYTYLKRETDDRNSYLEKVLQANELVIEIRDLVEHSNDLTYVFDFLLSKIRSVITSSTRACVLKIDQDFNLYMETHIGYEDEYIDAFRIPYKDSFSYMHLQNDYSRSVIINDVQKRYSELFPDIATEEEGFGIQSNIETPLVVDGKLYGIISVDSNQNNVFDQVDLYLLDFIKVQLERAIDKQVHLENIERESKLDPLTELVNRREMLRSFESFRLESREFDSEFIFVLFDLDGLKKVNDMCGHNCGDKILKQFSFKLKNSTRKDDVISRIGGDEFVGLFRGINIEKLEKRIKKWQSELKKSPIIHKGKEYYANFSYGMVVFPEAGNTYEEVLEHADQLMYLQKNRKKDIVL